MSAAIDVSAPAANPLRLGRVVIYTIVTALALDWLIPIAGAIFASFRPFSDTSVTVSFPGRTP